MPTLLPHKQALYEIFQAEIDDSAAGLLYGKCDGILFTAVEKLASTKPWTSFIILGDYEAEDVSMGWNTERCRIYNQSIHIASALTGQILEYEAEYTTDELARIVRQILKENQSLVSTTYTTGIALESHLRASRSEFVQYFDLRVNMQTIVLYMKVKET
jgi:hypothetical protein